MSVKPKPKSLQEAKINKEIEIAKAAKAFAKLCSKAEEILELVIEQEKER
jgi:hypothetical protein